MNRGQISAVGSKCHEAPPSYLRLPDSDIAFMHSTATFCPLPLFMMFWSAFHVKIVVYVVYKTNLLNFFSHDWMQLDIMEPKSPEDIYKTHLESHRKLVEDRSGVDLTNVSERCFSGAFFYQVSGTLPWQSRLEWALVFVSARQNPSNGSCVVMCLIVSCLLFCLCSLFVQAQLSVLLMLTLLVRIWHHPSWTDLSMLLMGKTSSWQQTATNGYTKIRMAVCSFFSLFCFVWEFVSGIV